MKTVIRPESEMKDSGIECIESIPKGWITERIKNLFSERNEKVDDAEPNELLSVSEYYGVAPRSEKINSDTVLVRAESLQGYKRCEKNDLVSNIMLAWKGAMGISQYRGVVSPSYCVYTPQEKIFPQYYHYLFRTDAYKGLFKKYSTGIIESRLRLYTEQFFARRATVPPLSEQQAIANYLDETCSKIDEIIAEAKASIDEYKELKQAVIFEAVTKGLDKNVEMKESGVEWIGKTPFNWKVAKLGRYIEILPGYAFSSADFSKRGIRLLRGVNVTPNGARWNDVVYWDKEISDDLSTYLLEEGDIVVGLDRPWISDGARIFIISSKDLPCLLLQRVCRIRCKKIVRNEFLYHWLKSKAFEEALTTETTGISVPHISTNQIKDFKITFPSEIEQNTIIEYLNKRITEIDSLIIEKESLINDLEAYKKSLIYEVVTGKRRVV